MWNIIEPISRLLSGIEKRITLVERFQAQTPHAVNLSLTARNWLVGYYIVEYKQQAATQFGGQHPPNFRREIQKIEGIKILDRLQSVTLFL